MTQSTLQSVDIQELNTDYLDQYQSMIYAMLDDCPDFFAKEKETYEAYSPQQREAKIQTTKNTYVLGAFIQNVLAGILHVRNCAPSKFGHVLVIGEAYVLPQYRNDGVMTKLLTVLEEEESGKRDAFFKICGSLHTDNIPMKKLFKKMGYKQTGILEKEFYTGGEYHDELLFEKLINREKREQRKK